MPVLGALHDALRICIRFYLRGFHAGDSAESKRFPNIAAAVIEIRKDGTEFASGIKMSNHTAAAFDKFGSLIAFRAALRIREGFLDFDTVERRGKERLQIAFAAFELKIFTLGALFIVKVDLSAQTVWINAELAGKLFNRIAFLHHPGSNFFFGIFAPGFVNAFGFSGFIVEDHEGVVGHDKGRPAVVVGHAAVLGVGGFIHEAPSVSADDDGIVAREAASGNVVRGVVQQIAVSGARVRIDHVRIRAVDDGHVDEFGIDVERHLDAVARIEVRAFGECIVDIGVVFIHSRIVFKSAGSEYDAAAGTDKAVAAFAFDHHAVNYPGLFILKEFDCRRFVPNVDAAGAVFNVFLHQRIELAVCTGQ